MATAELKHEHCLLIQASPDRIWNAITNPAETVKYFHGTRVRSEFVAGSRLEYVLDEGDAGPRVALEGDVEKAVRGRELEHTFSFPRTGDRPSRVRWEIEPLGENLVRLKVVHHDFDGETETYRMTRDGWPPILSSLKTLLETGRPLEFPEQG